MSARRVVALMFGASMLASFAGAQTVGPRDRAELARFVDSIVPAIMARDRIPGAAFCFVRDGATLFCRAYGLANVERRVPASVDSTIWRIGSISKVFTAFAVVQLADRSLVDLNADANRYLRSVQIPVTRPEPVLVRHLIDHTAGFDEIRPGTMAASAAQVLPLGEFLSTRLVRLRTSGATTSYSTYGMTIAGAIIEDVSGMSYEQYMTSRVWGPLGMRRTNVNVPSQLAPHVAMGYEVERDSVVPQPWEWYHTTPASSINSTAADMATFMIANLDPAKLSNAGVMSERAATYMQRQQATVHPRLPGFALGFYEDYVGQQRTIEHAGSVAGFSSVMVLLPDHRSGFFIVHHRESGGTLRDEVREALLTRFYPATRVRLSVPPPPPDFKTRIAEYIGRYGPMTSCHSCTPRSVPYLMHVTAAPDSSAIVLSNRRWIEVAPLLFVREDGTGYVSFRRDSAGRVWEMFIGNIWPFERLP